MDDTDVFLALDSADRQILLSELVTTDGPVSEVALTRTVAARRHQAPRESVREPTVHRTYLRLMHVHLPLLVDVDVVTRDDEVALTDDACRERLLEAADVIDASPPDNMLALPAG